MQEADIKLMGEQERTYWWHVSRRLIWRTVLGRFLLFSSHLQILDVGCGGGFNLELLKQWGEVVGIDQSPVAISAASSIGKAEVGDAMNLPRLAASQDLVTAFDVLEHLGDDEAALREWARVLKVGGYMFISVPAYQWLFSAHDKVLAHRRRYTRAELENKLRRVGCSIIFSSYIFMFTFPVFVIQRLLSKGVDRAAGYNPAPSVVNKLLIVVGQLEAALLRWVSLPFGSSVIILAKKL